MTTFSLGTLTGVAASKRPELLAEPTRAALASLQLLDEVAVVEIDPERSDTARTQEAYGLLPQNLANCVVVGGRRQGEERIGACVVLADTKADVNGVVRRLLDVRKASFLATERAVEMTGMAYGGIAPIGLPADWPVLLDRRVAEARLLVIGSGIRRSKLLVPGSVLAGLPNAQLVEGLGI